MSQNAQPGFGVYVASWLKSHGGHLAAASHTPPSLERRSHLGPVRILFSAKSLQAALSFSPASEMGQGLTWMLIGLR